MSEIIIDRGMIKEEVNSLLKSPMSDMERAFFRAIYETFYRANELLQCDIEDYNRKTGELIAHHTKNKYNPQTKKYIKSPPKHMILSPSTQSLFRKIIGNRKKGAIFYNPNSNRDDKRYTVTHFQIRINEIATKIDIQKVAKITFEGVKPSWMGKPRHQHLVTLKALREAGERHTDLSGADSEVTARGAQHSALVKERYYKKSGWEEVQEQVKKFHPSFRGEI